MDSEWIEVALGSAKEVRRFEEGEPIFLEGDAPQGVYVVQDGIVDLTFSARNGNTRSTHAAERGEILGLSAVATQNTHECSATARSTCEIGFINRHDFLRALEETPSVWFAVLHFLSREVNAAYDEMRNLAGRQRERTSA
jgi:CRP/FNR family cyclic AMP-dependent transcriptional regulator